MKNKYIRFLILILAVAIVVPQIALAAWWNPFSWNWGRLNSIFHFQQTEQKQEQAQNQNQEQTVCTMDAKQCPDGSYVGREGPKCEFKACPSSLLEDVSPLFLSEDLKWSVPIKKMTQIPVVNTTIAGYEIKAQGTINQNQDAGKFMAYYEQKLKALGWSTENNFAADGINGSQVGYKKGDNYIVLSYKITPGKILSGENEPTHWECPCGTVYTIFSGSVAAAANNQATTSNPVHKGSEKLCASDSECPSGEKCFECHGAVQKPLPSYPKHCYTQQWIDKLASQCASM